jgi:hypothetical protein
VEAFGDFLFILIKLKGPKTLSIDLPESKKGEIFVFVCIHATSRIIKLMKLSSRFLFSHSSRLLRNQCVSPRRVFQV